VADHLSLDEEPTREINDSFPDEFILNISTIPWYANIVKYLAAGTLPEFWTKRKKSQFIAQTCHTPPGDVGRDRVSDHSQQITSGRLINTTTKSRIN
jgi:hypothetical protein